MKRALRHFLLRYGRVCEKTGAFRLTRKPGGWSALIFPVIGIAALVWLLIRVVPKPARLTYPCMKVAAPVASGFLVWLIGLATSAFAFKKAREKFHRAGFRAAFGFAVLALVGLVWTIASPRREATAAFRKAKLESPNQPMGTAQGLFPGRVVWVWNPDATNGDCTNRYGDGWFLPKNNDQAAIDKMLSDGIHSLTGKSTDAEAWDAIFKFHNAKRGKGETGYIPGEKIFIKTNATSSWGGNFNTSDLSVANNRYYGIAETNPFLVLSVLRQLVNVVGAAQTDIYVADPLKHIYKHVYDVLHPEFPNVHYMDHDYGASMNREKVAYTANPAIHYSDRGTVMKVGTWNDPTAGAPTLNDKLCTLFESCEYLINIPTLKGHKRGGVTMFAKNHFGSHGRADASHLHGGLVNPTETDPSRLGYGLYRVLVDLMAHKWLGGKQLFWLMDALYAGPESVFPPTKWSMAPFNDDWMSSIFLSQDPVAIESVGYDFLRAQYTEDYIADLFPQESFTGWVQMDGVDDYLHQAADNANWPAGITYDPDNPSTVTPIGSLGVHEHWDSETDMKYTRNLGTGNGIELVRIDKTSPVESESAVHGKPEGFRLYANYPNPFNPSTTIRYDLSGSAYVEMFVYNVAGRRMAVLVSESQRPGTHAASWNGLASNGEPAPSGVYVCSLRTRGDGSTHSAGMRMLLVK